MADSMDQKRFGYRVGRAFTRLVVTLLVLGLVGTVGFLLSQLNARTFTFEVRDRALHVLKGKMLPIGSQVYRPLDPALADAYAPLPLEDTAVDPSLAQQRFTERDEVDRALFEMLKKLAQPRVISDDPPTLERGLYYLRRAQKLSGISAEQRLALKQMEADVAYYQARLKLEDARKLVAEALAQLKAASETPNRHARSATQMISAVETPARGLEDALRNAVNSLSAPAADLQAVPPPTAVTPPDKARPSAPDASRAAPSRPPSTPPATPAPPAKEPQ